MNALKKLGLNFSNYDHTLNVDVTDMLKYSVPVFENDEDSEDDNDEYECASQFYTDTELDSDNSPYFACEDDDYDDYDDGGSMS